MRPRAVLFDCDGVLVDTEPQTRALLVSRLNSLGLALETHDLARMFLGGTIASVGQTAAEMGADVPRDWVGETYEALFCVLADNAPLIAGVAQLLDRLDDNQISYAVCSNGPLRKMDITLGNTGILTRFAGRIYSSHVHGAPKPAPDLYVKAARDLGLAAEDCVVIEDSPTGALSAQRAGMRCLGYGADSNPQALKAAGAEVVMSMTEVAARIGL